MKILIALVLGFVLVAGPVVIYYGMDDPAADALAVALLPDRLKLVLGAGGETADGIEVTAGAERGYALLSSPQGLVLDAARLEALRICGQGWDNAAGVHLVWLNHQAAGRPAEQTLELNDGCNAIDMRDNADWAGLLTGIGLQLQAPFAGPVTLTTMTVHPGALPPARLLQRLWQDWFSDRGWQGTSIHFVTVGEYYPLLSLTLCLAAWAGLSLGLYALLVRLRTREMALGLAGLGLLFWLAWDARWQWALAERAQQTRQQLAGKTSQDKLRVYDGQLVDFIEAVKQQLPAEPQRIFIVSEDALKTPRTRSHYHLLPHNANSFGVLPPPPELIESGDYVLVMGRHSQLLYGGPRGREVLAWGAEQQHRVPVRPLLGDRQGALFQVR